MGGIVVFVYADWAARYPELALWVNPAMAQMFFNEAGLYCDNTACSPVKCIAQRTPLLYMLTAHIAALNAPLNGQPSSPLVGRINQATEGSVTVQAEMNYAPGSAQWYIQTKYGAAFWQATMSYRSFRYAPGPRRVFNPVGVPLVY